MVVVETIYSRRSANLDNPTQLRDIAKGISTFIYLLLFLGTNVFFKTSIMTSTRSCTRILQLNAEGLTRAKRDHIRDHIRHLADIHYANTILLQEAHCTDEEKLTIEGFKIIDLIPSKYHGIATYTCDGITSKSIQKSPEGNPIEWITI